MALNVPVLRSSFETVLERQPQITPRFYEILFSRYPQARPLFGRKSQEEQAKMLQETLVAVVDHLEDASWLEKNLKALGEKHIDYGVTDDMYEWVGESLLATLAEVAGDDWTPEVESAWREAYDAIAAMMKEGAAESARERA